MQASKHIYPSTFICALIAMVATKRMQEVEDRWTACDPVPYITSAHVLKLILATLGVFVLMDWVFHMEETKEALKVVSPRFSWHSDIVKSIEKDPRRHPNVTDVLKHIISDSRRANASLENLCPLISPNLAGEIPIRMDVPSLEVAEKEFPDVMPGGRFRPKECTSRHKVAILVPYRNRTEHLKIFAYNIHRVLSRQQIDYGVFVIEQGDNAGFNRAKLFNVGYVEATALYDYQCFIFHDIDMIPIDDRNVYTCPEKPRHMSVNVNNKSMVFYRQFFGGVSAVNKEQMLRVNGYSNRYWGWGAEDDDMSNRLEKYGYKIHRRPGKIGRYATLAHVKSKPSEERVGLLRNWRSRVSKDGLNSLKYKRLDMAFKKFYTWILVDLRESM